MYNKEDDSRRVFQAAGWMWVIYLAAQAIIDVVIYANRPSDPLLGYYLVNGLPALVFIGLSYLRLSKSGEKLLSLVMLLLVTGAPIILKYLFDLRLPPAPLSNIEGMVLRQLPVLLIGLVLVAWHYNLPIVLFYSLGTNLLEFGIVAAFSLLQEPSLSSLYFIIIIRMVCLMVVGIFIHQLVRRLRIQQASLQAANAQLSHYASTLEQLTLSRERNRMSRELHDTVVHTLSGLSVELETAKAYWDVAPDTARSLLDQSLEATRTGLQETRRAIKALRASPLDDLGLVRAIQALADAAAQRGHLSVKVSLPGDDLFLAPDVEQCIYRIAQEGVENVIHHANARSLVVRLEENGSDICLTIQDDGIGFDPQANQPAGHFGMANMRERAALAGGELSISSQPKHGTTLELVIKGSTR